jgi:hypothetical protein
MLIEVLQPVETRLIIRPSILGRGDSLIGREAASFVSVTKMLLACNYDERRDRPSFRINSLDDCNPFTDSSLYRFQPSTPFYTYNHAACNQAHHKASHIKVADIS